MWKIRCAASYTLKRFKETPTEFEELSENVDALTIRPASNKRAKTEELGHPSFTLTEGKAGVSASSAGSFFSSRATKQEQDNIVATAMKFEAEHEELVRVLVYTESGVNIKVQLYVQYGESGIPQELQNAAQGCFGEMDVTLEWLDLINDADRILKIRSLEYPSGTPQSLTKSQASEISQAIRDNLHVLVRHRNITSVQPSLKITNSKQTDTPCITLYVLRKGVIPDGKCDFPLFLGSYPIDVVDGFWFRTIGPWKPNEAQKNSEVLRLGASIGVQGEDSAGILGAVVKGGDKFFALSCHHVMKRESSSKIIHPAQNDHLNYLKYHLREYGSWLRKIVDTDIPVDQLDVDDLTEQDQLRVRFEELKELRERYRDRITENVSILQKVDKNENKFEEGLEALPRVIGRYSAGVSRNVTLYSQTHYIDAAVAELTADEVNQLQINPTVEVIGTGYNPSGEVNSGLEAQGKFHKSDRTT
ncbi:hypothetical protein AWC38_SpisGene23818 [Stylophora pistillata]|uniref:Uncharacterized protein n=2 Tax=Stylophora pistillata TaxID=50429 RepID=A0A2B4R7K5_STYPI|nr:hypothetical protein AWC38_SpisGene23818 [Stylophora pistillata]